MTRTRVLIADDSPTVRSHLIRALEVDPTFEVVATASDGAAAASLCAELEPDVVTMDLTMPRLGGLEATQRIMATCPTAILVVADPTSAGTNAMLDALAAGAVDAIEKPTYADGGTWDSRFRSAVHVVAGVPVVRRTRVHGRRVAESSAGFRQPVLSPSIGAQRDVIALGASAGGPSAVAEILRVLPLSTPVTVLLCLHMGAAFAGFVTSWIGSQTCIPIRFARNGEPIPSASGGATVLIAPPGAHLLVRGGALVLDSTLPERHGCQPSIDVLFESVARQIGNRAIGCLLTGMGKDGARGLRCLRGVGAPTIVQDETTCAVFGMPAAAIELDAAEWVLPLPQIGAALSSLAVTPQRRRTQ